MIWDLGFEVLGRAITYFFILNLQSRISNRYDRGFKASDWLALNFICYGKGRRKSFEF
jgi:hypothetical protein